MLRTQVEVSRSLFCLTSKPFRLTPCVVYPKCGRILLLCHCASLRSFISSISPYLVFGVQLRHFRAIYFHSEEWSMSNFPCSLTRDITSHRWKMCTRGLYYQFPLPHLIHFSLEVWENVFMNLGLSRNLGKTTMSLFNLSLLISKLTFSQPFRKKCINEVVRIFWYEYAMKSHVLHAVRCNISGEAAGEIWHWSALRKQSRHCSYPTALSWVETPGHPGAQQWTRWVALMSPHASVWKPDDIGGTVRARI